MGQWAGPDHPRPLPACLLRPLPGPEGWLVTGDRGENIAEAGEEEAPPVLPLNTERGGVQVDTHSQNKVK